jgi:hypothetical protein
LNERTGGQITRRNLTARACLRPESEGAGLNS